MIDLTGPFKKHDIRLIENEFKMHETLRLKPGGNTGRGC
jgi:hypothetical protein